MPLFLRHQVSLALIAKVNFFLECHFVPKLLDESLPSLLNL